MRTIIPSILLLGTLTLLADETPKSPTLVDASGKEITLTKWKITSGVRKLNFLEGKPEVFDMREVGSTAYKQGISTYVPVPRVKGIQYDPEKYVAQVEIAGLEAPLMATLRYEGFNNITIEAEIDQGKTGIAEVKYKGGVLKGGIRSIQFPAAKAADKEPEGKEFFFSVPSEPTKKGGPPPPTIHSIKNVKPLYKTPTGEEKPLTYLMFKKTLKVEFDTVTALKMGPRDGKDGSIECEVKLKDGTSLTVSLLTTFQEDGKSLTFLGFFGECPAGWKLIPPHCTTEMLDEKPRDKRFDLKTDFEQKSIFP